MASKVIVKMPMTPFGQVNKTKSGSVNGDIVVTRSQDVTTRNNTEVSKGPEQSRAFQLEQNLRFLQEQHQLMLAGLHNEIDSLKNRNRELQFQLVFVKSTTPVSSPSSSSEDDLKHKVYSSPKQANVTPLHVEILERELGELKLQLQEAESRNIYLSAIVDEQKKKLERFERDQTSVGAEADLTRRLDDAESLIRRLRRENSDLRKEHAVRYNAVRNGSESNGYSTTPRSSGGQGGVRGNGGRHKGNNGHYRANWFPPLHSQSYWQQGRRTSNEQRPKNGATPETTSSTQTAPNMLPDVHQSQPTHQQQRQGRRGNNNNHYQEGGGGGGGRKYHRSQQKNSSSGQQQQQT